MQGKATFRGHPIHLMLVPFPVAFWTGALLTDLAGAHTRDPFWFRMSATLVMMGTAGAVLASLAGYVDYRTVAMSRKAHGVATGHMIWSLVTLAVFALAWWARAHVFASPLGIALTLAGAFGLFVAGYLGSELANRYRVGISETSADDERAKRRR